MKSTSLCSNCYYNFYNRSDKKCRHLESARVVQKTNVGIWQEPPYKWKPRKTYNCHAPNGSVWITKDDPRIRSKET